MMQIITLAALVFLAITIGPFLIIPALALFALALDNWIFIFFIVAIPIVYEFFTTKQEK